MQLLLCFFRLKDNIKRFSEYSSFHIIMFMMSFSFFILVFVLAHSFIFAANNRHYVIVSVIYNK